MPATVSVKAGGVEAAATRSSILFVCGGGVGGSSMMVGWLSMFEMSKSMSSMVSCRHARDGHALMEILISGGWKRGYLSVGWKRASVAFMEPRPHQGGPVPLQHTMPHRARRYAINWPGLLLLNLSPKNRNGGPVLAHVFFAFDGPLGPLDPLLFAPTISCMPTLAPVGQACFTKSVQ